MSKILRVLVTLIAALILLVLLAIIGLIVFVNPNDLKPQISQAVNKYTGRQLQLAGNIEWAIFPRLGLQLNDAKLNNTPGFGDKPFAQIKKLDIQVRLLPLLHKQLEIGKLYVNGLTLYLIKNAQGQNNWQRPNRSELTPTDANKPLNTNLRPLSFVIAGIDIQNGAIFFDDKQKNKHYQISQLQLKSTNITVNKSSPFFTQFKLNTNSPKLNANIKLATYITLSTDDKTIALNKLYLDILLNGATYPKAGLPISLQGDTTLNLNEQTFSSDQFTLSIAENKFTGNIAGQNLLDNPILSGVIKSEQFRASNLAIQQLELPFQFKNNKLSLDPITGQLYQGNYRGNVNVDLTKATPRFNTNSQFNQINIKSLFQTSQTKSQIQLAGLANVNFTLNSQGSDQDSLLKNLHGQGQFNLDNGAIEGINLSYWVAMGKALLNHQVAPNASSPITPFNKFMGSFTINRGILTSNDLSISSGHLTINGRGSIALPEQLINYDLHVQPVLADGRADGIAIPIRITGQFNNIRVTPMLDRLGVNIIKEKLKDRLQKHLQRIFQ
jgi:AsmA protein